MIETGFGKEFSEPPNVSVSGARINCEACGATLDVNVMHKCHGNKEYQPPVFSSSEITELCPVCPTEGVLVERDTFQEKTFVVVCKSCRTYVWPEVSARETAIHSWNAAARGAPQSWPKWLADMPGDDERVAVIAGDRNNGVALLAKSADLTNYRGACPAVHVEGEDCHLCENTGMVPPTKPVSVAPTDIVVPPTPEGAK